MDFVSLQYPVVVSNPVESPRKIIPINYVSAFRLNVVEFIWSHGKGW